MVAEHLAWKQEVVARFNENPEAGILLYRELSPEDKRNNLDIVHFLTRTKGIDRLEMGKYMAGNNKQAGNILAAFLEAMDLRHTPWFIDALRKLPEIVVVHRNRKSGTDDTYLEVFARKWCDHNPIAAKNMFSSEEESGKTAGKEVDEEEEELP